MTHPNPDPLYVPEPELPNVAQTVPQGTLDYGKGYSDGYRAALADALAAVHDVASVRLAFREDPTKATPPAIYVALDAIVEILRSGPP